jgi:acetyl-CoA synthetase
MLACARIGAAHSVVFGGFSAESLRDRIRDAEAKLLITADGGYRRGGVVPLKRAPTRRWTRGRLPHHRARAGGAPPRRRRRDAGDARCARAATSGGTRRGRRRLRAPSAPPRRWTPRTCSTSSTPPAPRASPRGSCTPPGGYLTQVYATTKWVFDLKEDDVYWCTADVGWVTGHSYIVYGPLANGATVVMYEGAPDFPDRGRFWELVRSTASPSSTPRPRRSAPS